jgi:hypothetical protein
VGRHEELVKSTHLRPAIAQNIPKKPSIPGHSRLLKPVVLRLGMSVSASVAGKSVLIDGA